MLTSLVISYRENSEAEFLGKGKNSGKSIHLPLRIWSFKVTESKIQIYI